MQLVKKFPAFHGTRRFITALTSARHLSLILGQPNPVHIPTSHLLEIHPNIIHPSTPRSPQWSLSVRFHHQTLYTSLSSPIRATCPAHLILLDFITRTILGEEYKSFEFVTQMIFVNFSKLERQDSLKIVQLHRNMLDFLRYIKCCVCMYVYIYIYICTYIYRVFVGLYNKVQYVNNKM